MLLWVYTADQSTAQALPKIIPYLLKKCEVSSKIMNKLMIHSQE